MAGGDTKAEHIKHVGRVKAAIGLLGVPALKGTFPTIYGGKEREGITFTYKGGRYLVIARWQGVGGTADEKIPFLFESVKRATAYDTVVLVYGGDGAKSGAMEWLAAACEGWKGKPQTILLRSSDAFRGACQRAAAHPGEPLTF